MVRDPGQAPAHARRPGTGTTGSDLLTGRSTRWLVGALFAICAFLLVTMGGAIVAAPVTLPLMYLAARAHPTSAVRWAGGVVAGLTAAELAWAAVYVASGEASPLIFLLPPAAGLAVAALFVALGRHPVPAGAG